MRIVSHLSSHVMSNRRKVIGVSFSDFVAQLAPSEDLVFGTKVENRTVWSILETEGDFESQVPWTSGYDILGFWAVPRIDSSSFDLPSLQEVRDSERTEKDKAFDYSWRIISRPTEQFVFRCMMTGVTVLEALQG